MWSGRTIDSLPEKSASIDIGIEQHIVCWEYHRHFCVESSCIGGLPIAVIIIVVPPMGTPKRRHSATRTHAHLDKWWMRYIERQTLMSLRIKKGTILNNANNILRKTEAPKTKKGQNNDSPARAGGESYRSGAAAKAWPEISAKSPLGRLERKIVSIQHKISGVNE